MSKSRYTLWHALLSLFVGNGEQSINYRAVNVGKQHHQGNCSYFCLMPLILGLKPVAIGLTPRAFRVIVSGQSCGVYGTIRSNKML